MRVLPVLCVAGFVLSACGGSSGSALSIKVELSGSSAQCVSAGVRLASGKELETAPAKRGTKTTMVFGVGATGEIKGKVTPFARGWKASACAQIGTAPADETATGGTVDLGQPSVQTVTLALKAPATGTAASCSGPASPSRATRFHWRAVLGLAAVAGEVLRARAGGRWALHPAAGALPCVFLLGPAAAPIVVDPLGAAIRWTEGGEGLAELLTVAG